MLTFLNSRPNPPSNTHPPRTPQDLVRAMRCLTADFLIVHELDEIKGRSIRESILEIVGADCTFMDYIKR